MSNLGSSLFLSSSLALFVPLASFESTLQKLDQTMLTVQHLSALRESLPPDTTENADLREDLMVEARKLLLSLERPDNVVERIGFQAWLFSSLLGVLR